MASLQFTFAVHHALASCCAGDDGHYPPGHRGALGVHETERGPDAEGFSTHGSAHCYRLQQRRHPERALRLAQTHDKVDDPAESGQGETEERGGGLSSTVSEISNKITMKLKMAWWRDLKKSEAYVKKQMGLEGLSGAALTSHKNYNLFLKYKATIEKDWLDGMARGGFPRHSVRIVRYDIWVRMGFERVGVGQLNQIRKTEEFRIYKNYVKAFDKNVESTIGSGYLMPKFVSEKATPAEMTARVEIWAETGKPASYVKMMLGMDSASGAKANAQYFEHFKWVANALRKTT